MRKLAAELFENGPVLDKENENPHVQLHNCTSCTVNIVLESRYSNWKHRSAFQLEKKANIEKSQEYSKISFYGNPLPSNDRVFCESQVKRPYFSLERKRLFLSLVGKKDVLPVIEHTGKKHVFPTEGEKYSR